MHEIIRPGLVLLLITAIAAALLGFVHDVTKGPIEFQQAEATASSLRALLPDATDFKEELQIPDGSPVISAYTAYANSDAIGYVFGVEPKGYSGGINTLVGIGADGTLLGIKIVSQTETPGLGTNCELPNFTDQYIGKTGPLTVTKTGSPGENEIQAITSSTITTKAVTLGVNQALEFFHEEVAK